MLCNEVGKVLATGGYDWENSLIDGLWSCSLSEAVKGMQSSYAELVKNYGEITTLDAIGFSGMMHGYLALDKEDNLLVPFRTWRNTNTAESAQKLSELFNFNVPMRWSVSQYYQCFLEGLDHVNKVAFLTTLAGYIHYLLTGEKVIGPDDASGMFPLDGADYDGVMLEKFNGIIGKDFKKLLPKVLRAGSTAGYLTLKGAKLLDPSGKLQQGAVFCPPEGDMGTGMICTNAVAPETGNVSSGTCANLTVILEKPLKNYYKNIDIVSTPNGYPAALIHSNNGTTEINEWVNMFGEVAELLGLKVGKGELFTKLFLKSAESDGEVGKFSAYNYDAGEVQADTIKGAPMVVRKPDGIFNLANFMQAQIYSVISPLALGLDTLKAEGVKIAGITAHGGFYKTEFIGQNATSAVLGAPVTVMENAGEGGAWGIALLAGYVLTSKVTLSDYLNQIFSNIKSKTVTASESERKKCKAFLNRYKDNLPVEKLASEIK